MPTGQFELLGHLKLSREMHQHRLPPTCTLCIRSLLPEETVSVKGPSRALSNTSLSTPNSRFSSLSHLR